MELVDTPLSKAQLRALRTLEKSLQRIGRGIDELKSGQPDNTMQLRAALSGFYTRACALKVVAPTSRNIPAISSENTDDSLYPVIYDSLSLLESARRARLRYPDRVTSDRQSEIVGLSIELQRIYEWTVHFALLEDQGTNDRDRMWVMQFHFWSGFGHDLASALRRMHSLANPIEPIW
jgi:hypothetical protein